MPNYGVIVATDKEMLKTVGEAGGHAVLGAAIRVGVKDDGTVSYTNPDYWYRAYFRNDFASKQADVKDLQEKLASALGAGRGFGGDEPSSSLASYRYMVGMEKLDSYKNKLNEFDSFEEAVKTVRDNLSKGIGKTSKVYEVVIPERKVAVFGVSMGASGNNDGTWIKKIEQQDSIAGLPYEVYVVGNTVNAPHGRFRIALSFPDVKMGQFMRISSLPNTILENLSEVAGVEKQSLEESW